MVETLWISFLNIAWASSSWFTAKFFISLLVTVTLNPNPRFLLMPKCFVCYGVLEPKPNSFKVCRLLWATNLNDTSHFWPEMLYISRCQALKRPLRWPAKPLAHSIRRPLSLSPSLSLRPTSRFRQEEQPELKEKVRPLENSDSFYEKMGKPGIKNQVIVSRVTLSFPPSNLYL